MGFFFWILCVFFLEETYPPVILVTKAADLRRRTKNWGIHAKQEEVEVDLKELLTKNVSRPFRILFTEPIVLLITIYMSFIYGLLYLFLTAYAVVFQEVHGFNRGVGGLPYFGMVVGELIGFAAIILLNPSYTRKLQSTNNIPVPEWRLPLAIAGGISFSAGLFWFGKLNPFLLILIPTLQPNTSLTPHRLDRLHSFNSLDCPDPVGPPNRLRHLHHIPPTPQLHHRRLPDVRRFRNRRKHFPPLPLRLRVSVVRNLHV